MRSFPRPFAELRLQSVGYGSRADVLVVGHYLECLSFFDFTSTAVRLGCNDKCWHNILLFKSMPTSFQAIRLSLCFIVIQPPFSSSFVGLAILICIYSIASLASCYYISYPIPLTFQSLLSSSSLPARWRLISKAISLAMAIRRSSHTVTSNAIRRVKAFTSPFPPST